LSLVPIWHIINKLQTIFWIKFELGKTSFMIKIFWTMPEMKENEHKSTGVWGYLFTCWEAKCQLNERVRSGQALSSFFALLIKLVSSSLQWSFVPRSSALKREKKKSRITGIEEEWDENWKFHASVPNIQTHLFKRKKKVIKLKEALSCA
jgi:hypothetical protein